MQNRQDWLEDLPDEWPGDEQQDAIVEYAWLSDWKGTFNTLFLADIESYWKKYESYKLRRKSYNRRRNTMPI